MASHNKIGIYDSGLGGVSILQLMTEQFPDREFIYFADTMNFPYGNKTKHELETHCLRVHDFLISKGAEKILIACNTASSLFYDTKVYKKKPLLNILKPTMQAILQYCRWSGKTKVGVLATRFTVSSQIYVQKLKQLNPQITVIQQAAPELADFVEQGMENTPACREALKSYMEPLLKQSQVLVPACAHYFFLLPQMMQVAAETKVLDSREYIIKDFSMELSSLRLKDTIKKGCVRLFLSQPQPYFEEKAKTLLCGGSIQTEILSAPRAARSL